MRRRWLPELDEHDRDVFEAETAYFAWLDGKPCLTVVPREEPRDDGYCERDPFDRLENEGGYLGE